MKSSSTHDITSSIFPTNTFPDLHIQNEWDSSRVASLIRSKTVPGASGPAFLFLGTHEARLLRKHLGAAFGEEAVASMKDLYYMGLEVVEVEVERFFRIAGRKTPPSRSAAPARSSTWRDRDANSIWSLRLG